MREDNVMTPPLDHREPQQLYFAFGSNLSTTQMRSRCDYNPEISGNPLAIARLDGWRWIICQRGYGNVVRCTGEDDDNGHNVGGEDGKTVYGVIYGMTSLDENILDGYEGVDHDAPKPRADSAIDHKTRPREQGRGSYNKWYLPVTVTRWIDEDARDTFPSKSSSGSNSEGRREEDILTVLVYIDEYRLSVGPSKQEYIGRINRGVKEATALGLPQHWVDNVVRKYIPEEASQPLIN